ncbi:MAG: cell division protein SepF [Nanoarchaeota archaeon]
MVFNNIKRVFGIEEEPEYIEIDLGKEIKKAKVLVRPFVLKTFEDIGPIINSLREGYTIAIIDIKPLRSKDIIELKRAISKIKKTADALEGSIAGFGENVIIATPPFADIHRNPEATRKADKE